MNRAEYDAAMERLWVAVEHGTVVAEPCGHVITGWHEEDEWVRTGGPLASLMTGVWHEERKVVVDRWMVADPCGHRAEALHFTDPDVGTAAEEGP